MMATFELGNKDLLVRSWQSAVVAIMLLAASAIAMAESPKELAQKYGCMACHNAKTNLVGPAFNAIAAKYRLKPDAREKLIRKLKMGGTGEWGVEEQPPYVEEITDQNHYKILIDWVLSY